MSEEKQVQFTDGVEQVISLAPHTHPPRKGKMPLYLTMICFITISALVVFCIGISALLDWYDKLAQQQEERIIETIVATIEREDFAIQVQDLSTEERLKYIAILSEVPQSEEAPADPTKIISEYYSQQREPSFSPAAPLSPSPSPSPLATPSTEGG